MSTHKHSYAVKFIIALFIPFFLVACAAPLGTVSLHAVGQQGMLESPLVKSKELNKGDMIFKSNPQTSMSGDDVFSIYLTDSYLRYLQDMGGVNEVLFVIEFTEVVNGNQGDTLTKVLGPYRNLADASKAPMLNKLLYGPKRMESDVLSMNLKVYEYDLEENDNSASMLEFIETSTKSLNLSNPITQGEIAIAAEIGKTLVSMNENDLVLEMDLDFVAGNNLYRFPSSSYVLPLKDSELYVVKQEACRVGTCYGYFSKQGSNLPGLVTDTLMFVPTAIMRGTTDIPDSNSLSAFKPKKKIDGEHLISGENGLQVNNELYEQKTWMRFNIVKGGDPSQWEIRKRLYPLEDELNKLLKNPSSLGSEGFSARLSEIAKKAQVASKYSSASISVNSNTLKVGVHFLEVGKNTSDICLNYSPDIEIIEDSARIIGEINKQTLKIGSAASATGLACFTISTNSQFADSTGEFQINYKSQGKTSSLFVPINAKAKMSITNVTCQSVKNESDELTGYKINAPVTVPEVIETVVVDQLQPDYKFLNNTISIDVLDKPSKLSIKDVFGYKQEKSLTCS
jgi:hypothetical protein